MHVSSNTTLFFKIFVPFLWLSFFGCLTIAFWFVDHLTALLPMSIDTFRWVLTVFYLVSLVVIFFTIWKLMRVEMFDEHFTASNFWTTYRFKWNNIERIKTSNYGLFRLVRIHLRQPGEFGRVIYFLPSKARFQHFLQERPDVAGLVR